MARRPAEVQLDAFPFVEPHSFRRRVVAASGGESRTMQSFKDECDLNRIVNHFHRTGQIPGGLSRGEGAFADVTGLQAKDLTERVNFAREVGEKVKDAKAKKAAEAAEAARVKAAEDEVLIAEAKAARAAAAAAGGSPTPTA